MSSIRRSAMLRKGVMFTDPPSYDAWLNLKPCIISLQVKMGECEPSPCTSEVFSDSAHAPKSRRYGTHRVPLCRGHHVEQHTTGIETFAQKYFRGGIKELLLAAIGYERGYRKYIRRLQ